jgi:hypothetical protein
MTMADPQSYILDIDGPLFCQQRELLGRIANLIGRQHRYNPLPGDADLLSGLVELTDAIADQAHDRFGIDCVLTDENDGRC